MKQMFNELLLSPTIAEQANWQQIQGAAHAVHHWPGESARQASEYFDELLRSLVGAGRLRSRVARR
jgi:hypothetical protein